MEADNRLPLAFELMAADFVSLTSLSGVPLEIHSTIKTKTRFGDALIIVAKVDGKDTYVMTSSKRIMAAFEGFDAYPITLTFTFENNRWSVKA